MNNRPSIDWNAFIARLTGIALGWMAGRKTGMINAKDAADLAKNAAVEVFEKYHLTGPAKTEGELFAIALKAMRNDFLDQIKSSSNRTNVPVDGILKSKDGHRRLAAEDATLDKIEEDSVKNYYYSLAEGDQRLIDYIDAVLELEVYKREDAAALLDVSPQDITNMTRKLRYRHARREKKASNLKLV